MSEQRDSFSSKLGFILAAIGFAIGMGTFWRFPYLAGQNGGAIFLLFYIIAMAVIALPLFAMEMSMGSCTKKDAVGAYATLAPGKLWFLNGYANVLAMTLIVGSTLPIGGWVLCYVIRAAIGSFSNLTPSEVSAYYQTTIVHNPLEISMWVLTTIGLLTLIIRQRLDKGLEVANKICMPLLFLIMVALSLRAMTLPGAESGIEFFFTPDFSKVSPEIILVVVGQAFYAVGVAMAVSIVFGSYMQDKDKQIVKNTLAVGGGIISAAIFAGMMIFPSVFAFGLEPTAGPSLIFETMPNVFNQLPMGRFFSVIFYILFFLAAFSTWLAGYEALVATMRDQFKWTRSKSVWIGAVIIAIFGLLSANSPNMLQSIDTFVGHLLTLGAFVAAIFGGWFWGLGNFYAEAHITNKSAKIILSLLIKFIIPAVVLILWLQVAGIV